ncbi:unnamed protein product [Moneuplotes crassus]|uniref:Uncharacterized protein n=1 Tax=Euplotes crassus TaxID=5936 RepID=A0AAD2D4U3_EUPCR|nr:unnamed protein product [Moneuplotes crassus]
MEPKQVKLRPSLIPKLNPIKEQSSKKRKIVSKVLVKGQTRSQATIQKFFNTNYKVSDSNRDSQNKRVSVNSGTIATTTSTNKKIQNFSSIGSFGDRKNSKPNFRMPKIYEIEVSPEKHQGQTSLSPESDYVNLDSVQRMNPPSQADNMGKIFQDHNNQAVPLAKAFSKNAESNKPSQKYLEKIRSTKKLNTNQFGSAAKIPTKLTSRGPRQTHFSEKSSTQRSPKEGKTMKGMKKQLEKLHNKYRKNQTHKNWCKQEKNSRGIEEAPKDSNKMLLRQQFPKIVRKPESCLPYERDNLIKVTEVPAHRARTSVSSSKNGNLNLKPNLAEILEKSKINNLLKNQENLAQIQNKIRQNNIQKNTDSSLQDCLKKSKNQSVHRDHNRAATQSEKKEHRLPRFINPIDKSQDNYGRKYKNLSANSQCSVLNNHSNSASPDNCKSKKLRQAQFELNKLKEEITKKNIEVLAITKELQKWENKGNPNDYEMPIGNMKRKSSLSPYFKEKLAGNHDSKDFRFNTLKNGKITTKPSLKVNHQHKIGLFAKNLKVVQEEQCIADSEYNGAKWKNPHHKANLSTLYQHKLSPKKERSKKCSQNISQNVESNDFEKCKNPEILLSRSSSCLDLYGSLMKSKDICNKNVMIGSSGTNNKISNNTRNSPDQQHSLHKDSSRHGVKDRPKFSKFQVGKISGRNLATDIKSPSYEGKLNVNINSLKMKKMQCHKGKRNFEYTPKGQAHTQNSCLGISSKSFSSLKGKSSLAERGTLAVSSTKFDGFRDDSEIIINPEFGKSLKASLKASKRRLMLFIDNNDSVNPVAERSKFAVKKPSKEGKGIGGFKLQQRSKKQRYGQQEPEGTERFSLGLNKEDIVQSVEKSSWESSLGCIGDRKQDDIVLCEFEPLPKYFRHKDT